MQSISDFFTWLFSDRTGVICLVVAGAIWYSIGKQNTKPGKPAGGNNPPRETPDNQK